MKLPAFRNAVCLSGDVAVPVVSCADEPRPLRANQSGVARDQTATRSVQKGIHQKAARLGHWVLAVLLSSPIFGHAAVLVSLEATGEICNLASNHCTTNVALTGTVTLDRIGNPTIVDATQAEGKGWISSVFDLQWAGGSFRSTRVAAETYFSDNALTWNDQPDNQTPPNLFDSLYASFDSRFENLGGPTQRLVFNGASFFMGTEDTSWLSDLSFPFDAGLAPLQGFSGRVLNFDSFDTTAGTDGVSIYADGSISGTFDLTAFRVQAIPEPGTLVLAGLGILGVIARLRWLRAPGLQG